MLPRRPRRPLAWVYAIAIFTALLHAACIEQFGWFRDELYYMACGQHPALGYVDHPPLIGWVAAALIASGARTLAAVRAVPVLVGMLTIVLTAHLSLRLGARRWGVVLSALAVAFTPTYLFMFHCLSMNCFEVLLWTAAAYLVFDRDAATPRTRWIVLGVVLGVGLLNKHNLVFWLAAWASSLPFTGKARLLGKRGPWLAALVAMLIVVPHGVWQVRHGFPSLEFYRNAQAGKIQPLTPLGFVLAQLSLAGPGNVLLWLMGLVGLLRGTSGKEGRGLGITYLLLLVWFILVHGKAYYLVPIYPVLFAAGGATLEHWLESSSPRRRALALTAHFALVAALGFAAMPLGFPIASVPTTLSWAKTLGQSVPKAEKGASAELPQHLADMFGWDTLVRAVEQVQSNLTPEERRRVQILASNYGQAAAIDWLGRDLGLPSAHSPHNAYYTWGPPLDTGGPVIVIGSATAASFDYTDLFLDVKSVGVNPCRYCMPFERLSPIYLCRKPKRPLADVWPQLKRYF